jgi:hypothetical protein
MIDRDTGTFFIYAAHTFSFRLTEPVERLGFDVVSLSAFRTLVRHTLSFAFCPYDSNPVKFVASFGLEAPIPAFSANRNVWTGACLPSPSSPSPVPSVQPIFFNS